MTHNSSEKCALLRAKHYNLPLSESYKRYTKSTSIKLRPRLMLRLFRSEAGSLELSHASCCSWTHTTSGMVSLNRSVASYSGLVDFLLKHFAHRTTATDCAGTIFKNLPKMRTYRPIRTNSCSWRTVVSNNVIIRQIVRLVASVATNRGDIGGEAGTHGKRLHGTGKKRV